MTQQTALETDCLAIRAVAQDLDTLSPRGLLLVDYDANAVLELAARHRTSGGIAPVAAFRPWPPRPLGAFADSIEELAAWIEPRHPEVLRRFGWLLANIFYPWRSTAVRLPARELRAGLADLVLREDRTLIHQYFQKRNVRPQVLSYVVNLVLEAAVAVASDTGKPLLMIFTGAELADDYAVSALRLINRYAQAKRVPLKLLVSGARSASEAILCDESWVEEWEITTGHHRAGGPLGLGFDSDSMHALEAAIALALPFRPGDWQALLESQSEPVETLLPRLVEAGALVASGEDRFRFANTALMMELRARVDQKRWRFLHAQALRGDEAAEPFAAAWHAGVVAQSEKLRARYLLAMEKAWALSAYDCAIKYAELAISAPGDDSESFDPGLLLALLNYEAERYQRADECFTTVNTEGGIVGPQFLDYLIGYNCIFGTGEFERGIELLTPVLAYYEEKGDDRAAAYVGNSLAFANFRLKNTDEAVRLEKINIDQATRRGVRDSFLLSILHLNLGRLYRSVGESERALDAIRSAWSPNSELSSHTLILFYGTVANVHFLRKNFADALTDYLHVYELLRDIQLDGLKDPVLSVLSKGAPPLPRERMTRTDAALFYLHFHIGLVYRHLGMNERAAPYLEHLERQVGLLGDETMQAVRAAFAGVTSVQHTTGTKTSRKVPTGGDLAAHVDEFQELLETLPGDEVDVERLVETLSGGGSIAVVKPRSDCSTLDSIVLYDPRSVELAGRMSAEVGGSYIQYGTAALVAPEATDLFTNLEPTPCVRQIASIAIAQRSRLEGLVPVQLAVQVLCPELDGFLIELVRRLSARAGVSVVAACPYHLWRRDLVLSPRQAVHAFLLSSLDVLVLDDRVIVKKHGATAPDNLMWFHPRLSEETMLLRAADGSVLLRVKRRGGHIVDEVMKLHSSTLPLLEALDGSLSVDELAARFRADDQGAERRDFVEFLRTLWRRGAICLDEMPPRAMAA